MSALPREVQGLYAAAPARVRAHIGLRWRSCPFDAVAARVPKSGRILEVGCGYGAFAAWLAMASPARAVLGIDIASDRIGEAQAAARRAEAATRNAAANLEYRTGAKGELPAGPWDAILFIDILYLLLPADQEKLLRAAARALAPGGVLLVKEVSNRPRAKAAWAFLQEILAVRVLRITQGRHVTLLPPARQAAWLAEESLDVELVPLDRGYPHAHHLIEARRPVEIKTPRAR